MVLHRHLVQEYLVVLGASEDLVVGVEVLEALARELLAERLVGASGKRLLPGVQGQEVVPWQGPHPAAARDGQAADGAELHLTARICLYHAALVPGRHARRAGARRGRRP